MIPNPAPLRFPMYVCLALILLLMSHSALAGDVYITPTASGGDTGANCANAHSASWFNSNATGGNTYHLCGAFTGTANTTMLTPASGSAGNPLIILFESGADLTSPQWSTNGAIYINGKNYVTVDGGTNGVIENTANGTGLAHNTSSSGIAIMGASSNIEIKNLTIRNIYQKKGSSSNGTGLDISVGQAGNPSLTNIFIHDNTLSAGYGGISFTLDANGSGYHVYNNTISDACHHIAMSENSGPHTYSDILIYGNNVTNWDNWVSPADGCHTDGIIIFGAPGSTMPVSVYNNYLHGDIQPTSSADASPTAFVFCTYGAASPGPVCTIYNNVIANVGDAQDPSGHNNVLIWLKDGRPGNSVYNNTLVGLTTSEGTAIRFETSTTTATLRNNIVTGFKLFVDSYDDPTTQATSNNNDFNGYTSGGWFYAATIGGSAGFYTLSQWKAAGMDANSTTGDPKLDANYKLQAGSAAISEATNLTPLAILPLDSDKAGTARPSGSTPWDAGTYQFGSEPAPSGLQASVQ